MSVTSVLGGSGLKRATTGVLAVRAGLALLKGRPKRAALLAGAALVSVKSSAGGMIAQILVELVDRK
jgi:hypothetical protein